MPGNSSVFLWKSCGRCLGRGKSENLCLDCCLCNPVPDKMEEDGWTDGFPTPVFCHHGPASNWLNPPDLVNQQWVRQELLENKQGRTRPWGPEMWTPSPDYSINHPFFYNVFIFYTSDTITQYTYNLNLQSNAPRFISIMSTLVFTSLTRVEHQLGFSCNILSLMVDSCSHKGQMWYFQLTHKRKLLWQ